MVVFLLSDNPGFSRNLHRSLRVDVEASGEEIMAAVSDGAMIALIEASAFSDCLPRQTAARLLLGFLRNGKDIEFRDRHFEEVRSAFGADVEREVSGFLEAFGLNEATRSFGPH